MINNNVITNQTLEQYNKKYRNRRYKLTKYSKKQVEDFDKKYGHYHFDKNDYKLKYDQFLLIGRKWTLIGDTYYEIPRPISFTWFRNLNTAIQIGTCALAGVMATTAIVVPTIIATKSVESKHNITIDSNEVEFQHSFQPDGSVIGNIKAKVEDKDILEIEISIGDYKLTKYEFKFDQETGDFEIYAETIKEHTGDIKITPIFTSEKKTRTFLFPQTIVNDPSVELMAAGQDKKDEEYFKFKNEYYVKDTAVPYEQSGFQATFSNGLAVEKNNTYYFKCEEIEWAIKGTGTQYSTCVSKKILYSNKYHKSVTDFDASYLKTWLNDYFFKNVFNGIEEVVVPHTDKTQYSTVTNSNIWLPSTTEVNNWDTEKNRIKEVTDFAICNGVNYRLTDDKKIGEYWTRTQSPDLAFDMDSNSENSGHCIYIVHNDGKIDGSPAGPADSNIGVVPCVNIKNEELNKRSI